MDNVKEKNPEFETRWGGESGTVILTSYLNPKSIPYSQIEQNKALSKITDLHACWNDSSIPCEFR
ncbi:hypothetical protein [Flavivirga jejuensis]|uniref:Uncharacterized protein n=1 Tax=Flavivirga jejuensis TaxID=870487 RepID=A0ABT8WUP0_9FLAO|nr:hypothetical protein [Flavivirga jejuensis]MDO5976906.1 hypothetical protein [Flavivirga jejuensis]